MGLVLGMAHTDVPEAIDHALLVENAIGRNKVIEERLVRGSVCLRRPRLDQESDAQDAQHEYHQSTSREYTRFVHQSQDGIVPSQLCTR
jgi:hypothetical protein